VSGQLNAPAALLPKKQPLVSHWIRGWVDTRAGLDTPEKKRNLPLPEVEPLCAGKRGTGRNVYSAAFPWNSIRFGPGTYL